MFVAAVTSRVSRLASDTRDTSQRTTRSQTRLLSEKGRDVSGKASGGHKLSRVAGESSTLPEKVQSLERKQGRSRSSATKSDRASDDNKASTKVPHYDIAVTSAELSKPPAAAVTSGKTSRSATQSTETMPPSTGLDCSPVDQPAEAEEANEHTTTMNDVSDLSDEDNDANQSDKKSPVSKVDVSYFRNLIQSESARLTMLCAAWCSTMNDVSDLSDEVCGSIRTAIGHAELLLAVRFKQFAGLVDNREFWTGVKEVTCSDLQRFWDMVYFQVEDADKKFAELDQLKAADWVIARQSPVSPKRDCRFSFPPLHQKQMTGPKSR